MSSFASVFNFNIPSGTAFELFPWDRTQTKGAFVGPQVRANNANGCGVRRKELTAKEMARFLEKHCSEVLRLGMRPTSIRSDRRTYPIS